MVYRIDRILSLPSLVSAALLLFLFGASSPLSAQPQRNLLFLPEVLESVRTQYPPYLAILIEQDIANGRARQALGAFDLSLETDGFANLDGFYDGSGLQSLLVQPLPQSGGSIYGGYRISSGFLPDYNKGRTGQNGQAILGLTLPLLKDTGIDKRRAALWKAEIDQELADPIILRQYLDFIRAATVSYYTWLSAGQRLALAEELLQIAQDRDSALAEQIDRGASAPIVRIDNQRLVVTREIGVVQATRRFEATAIELSLFHRHPETSAPILADRFRVPGAFPPTQSPRDILLERDIRHALAMRPEIRQLNLLAEKNEIDLRLARNEMLPDLSIGVTAYEGISETTPKDIDRTEVDAMLRLSIPLQRRKGRGLSEVAKAKTEQLERDRQIAGDRIAADVRDSYSALVAAHEGVRLSAKNVDLARQLEEAEVERLDQGVTDLLALQIREKASFDARLLEVEATAAYFRARADYEAAVAANAAHPPAEK